VKLISKDSLAARLDSTPPCPGRQGWNRELLLFFTTLETAKSRVSEVNPLKRTQSCSIARLMNPTSRNLEAGGVLEMVRLRSCFGIASGELGAGHGCVRRSQCL
jgi:hypothetical protein